MQVEAYRCRIDSGAKGFRGTALGGVKGAGDGLARGVSGACSEGGGAGGQRGCSRPGSAQSAPGTRIGAPETAEKAYGRGEGVFRGIRKLCRCAPPRRACPRQDWGHSSRSGDLQTTRTHQRHHRVVSLSTAVRFDSKISSAE